MGDPLVPCHVLMRLAGGALPGMNFDAFLEQADAYEDEEDLFSRQARFLVLVEPHPSCRRSSCQGTQCLGAFGGIRSNHERRIRTGGDESPRRQSSMLR